MNHSALFHSAIHWICFPECEMWMVCVLLSFLLLLPFYSIPHFIINFYLFVILLCSTLGFTLDICTNCTVFHVRWLKIFMKLCTCRCICVVITVKIYQYSSYYEHYNRIFGFFCCSAVDDVCVSNGMKQMEYCLRSRISFSLHVFIYSFSTVPRCLVQFALSRWNNEKGRCVTLSPIWFLWTTGSLLYSA